MSDDVSESDIASQRQDLEREQSFFKALLSSMGDVATMLDEKGVITYHSPGIREMLGVEPTDVVGIPAVDVVHHEDSERVADRIQYCLDHPDELLTENFRLGHADGSWRWLEAKIRNLLDDPNIGAILVVSRDITDRKRLEDQLSMAEQTTAFGLFRWDAETFETTISDTGVSVLGLEERKTVFEADEFFTLIHPDDLPLVRDAFLEAAVNPTPFVKTIRMVQDDGPYRYFAAHGFPETDESGKVVAVSGVIDDITDDMNTQRKLRENEAHYRLIADHTHDMFARHSPEGILSFLSPAAKSILGVDPEMMIGHDIVQFMHPDDQEMVREAFCQLGDTTDHIRMTFRIQNIEGNYLWVESTLQAIFSEATGKMVEAVAITRDISERKEYEQKLLDARENAETANRTKSTFLANMSHELRTPLNAIIGFSEIMKREMFGPLGNESYTDYSELIFDSGSHLLDLINDILDMSKIEAGKMDIEPEAIDLEDIAKSCLKLIELKASEKNLNLELDCALRDSDEAAFADTRATKQIVLNLLSNAVKFTGEGGTIRVEIRPLGDTIEIAVQDNGVGIDPESIPRLLRPFEQEVGVSSIAEEGSGLGLALTKSFCELQGGTFSLESQYGNGTRAIVTLPTVSSAKPASPPAAASAASAASEASAAL